MAISWGAFQTAVRTWVQGSAGLGANKIIWANQNGNRIERPFVTLRFGDLVPIGATDEKRRTWVGTPGAELLETVVGQRILTLTVQAFTQQTVGSDTARAILSKVQTALRLTTVRDALNNAGLAPFDIGTVQEISTVLDGDFEGRALMAVRFHVAETVSETLTYIEKVEPITGYTGVTPDIGTKENIDI